MFLNTFYHSHAITKLIAGSRYIDFKSVMYLSMQLIFKVRQSLKQFSIHSSVSSSL